MTVYDGTNPSALLTLTDTRNTQSYTIAKLADEKCWMLDNLKIADYVATSADTDLNTISTFSIPILENTGISETDIPHIYGPISGDTGSGSTNYGYAYNWSSATAGETTTSMPGDGTNNDIAPNSICPKNWYLPTAGPVGLDRDYDFLNARMAGLSHTQDEEYLLHYWEYQDNWKFNGPFRGVFASRYSTWYSEGFGVTDQTNGLWSATASSTTPSFAHIMNVNQTYLLPYHTTSRRSGWAVRCLIKTGTTATVLKPTITLDGVTIDSTTVVVSADFASISFPAPAHIAGTTSIVISNGTTGATLDYTFIAPTVPTFPFSPSSSFG
jgi:uncharacterized protein (TIGR02145 family)